MKSLRIFAALALIASSPFALADKVCSVAVNGGDNMMFDKKEIAVAADCTEVEITLKHTGTLPAQAMGHNWVLSKAADMAGVVSDGAGASVAQDHVKPGDARVIAHTKLIGGGQTDTVKFPTSKLKAGEAYKFFCTMPGHSTVMVGNFKFG